MIMIFYRSNCIIMYVTLDVSVNLEKKVYINM